MKCSNCGSEMPNDSIFCTKCGTPLNQVIEEKNYNKKPKGLDVPLNILHLIFFLASMIFVWGTTYRISVRSSYDYQNTIHKIGASYFLNDGWINLIKTSHNAYYTVGFFVLFIFFITMIVITYFFGIKGIMRTIKNISGKEEKNATNNFVIIALSYYLYYFINKLFIDHVVGINYGGTINYNYSTGWGLGFESFFIWLTAAFVIIRTIIITGKKKNPSKLISKILLAISIVILAPTASGMITNTVEINKKSYDLFQLVSDFSEKTNLIIFILIMICSFVGILTFVTTIYKFVFDKEGTKSYIIFSIALSVFILVSIISTTILLSTAYQSIEAEAGSDLIASLVASVISLGFVITSRALEAK